MKFLLIGINSKFIHSNPAIHYLKEYAGEEYKEHIELAEYTINNLREEILADIFERDPDVIGISCYIWNFRMVKELLPEIVRVLPGRDIWLGGPEVSYEGEEVLKSLPMVTGIFLGEGEATFKELLNAYCKKDECKGLEAGSDGLHLDPVALHEIRGLLLPDGMTGLRCSLFLDDLPFLYKDLEAYSNRIIYYETSRGCPYNCTYCLSAAEKGVRLRSMEKVEKELQFFLDQKVPQVKFVDRTFNCNREHALAIWRYIKEHDNGITNFHFEVAADIMNEEMIAVLAGMRPGLVQLEIGLQTTNEQTLHEIDRYADTGHIAEVVRRLQESENIHIHLDLIAGLPFEDYKSFANSFNTVYAMKPEQLQLGFLKVLKGSPMHSQAKNYGIVYQPGPPYEVLYTNWLSYADVLKLKRIEEMVEQYYNSNQFTKTLPVLLTNFESPFGMYERLSEYYEEMGYDKKAPARGARYQILLDFARVIDPKAEELYRELLTYDYYLRENAKSRPVFSKDLSTYYKEIFAFYEQEEEHPMILSAFKGYHARQTLKMTHMEVVSYPLWESDPQIIKQKRSEEAFLLFDYQKRSPLTGNAKVYVKEAKTADFRPILHQLQPEVDKNQGKLKLGW